MKQIKKAQVLERQKHIEKLRINKYLSFINIIIISLGFIFSYFHYDTIAKPLLIIGITLAVYVLVSNYLEHRSLKR